MVLGRDTEAASPLIASADEPLCPRHAPWQIEGIEQCGHCVLITAVVVTVSCRGVLGPSCTDESGGVLTTVYNWVVGVISDPNTWATIGGGALNVGLAIVGGISSAFFIFILTIYFIATLDSSKAAIYTLISASHRERVVGYAERIMQNVGRYLSGMVILAFFNATFSFIVLLIAQVPFALVIAVSAFFITLIPLIGTVLTTIVMTVLALFVSPLSGIIVLAAMLVYMQVEAYILTPRVMSKAVQVPGSIVLIAALAGGTLAGLPGALVAIPVAAGILLIIKEVVVPKKAVS